MAQRPANISQAAVVHPNKITIRWCIRPAHLAMDTLTDVPGNIEFIQSQQGERDMNIDEVPETPGLSAIQRMLYAIAMQYEITDRYKCGEVHACLLRSGWRVYALCIVVRKAPYITPDAIGLAPEVDLDDESADEQIRDAVLHNEFAGLLILHVKIPNRYAGGIGLRRILRKMERINELVGEA